LRPGTSAIDGGWLHPPLLFSGVTMLDLDPYLLLPLALVLFLMALPILSRKFYGTVTYILADELLQRSRNEQDIAILDLRASKEFNVGHIEGAVNVTTAEAQQLLGGGEAKMAEFRGRPLVFVCASDLDSTRLVGKLAKKGLTGAMVLKGGMFKWKRDHLPVVASDTASAR